MQGTLLLVRDPDRALRFYEGIGLRLDRRLDEEGVVLVGAGGSQLWLYSRAEGVERPAYPVAILAVDDLEAARERIEQHGGRIVSPRQEDPLGSNYYFTDPDRNLLEIRQAPATSE